MDIKKHAYSPGRKRIYTISLQFFASDHKCIACRLGILEAYIGFNFF
jgi:hypothetical protein